MGVTLPHTRGATPTGRIRWATVAPAARLHSIDNPERQGPAKRARLAATPFQVAMTNLVDPNVVSDLPRVNQYHSSASSSQNRKHCCRCNTCGGGPCTITTFPAAPVDAPPRYSRLVGHLQPRRYPPIPAVVDGRKTTPVSAVLDTVDSDDTLGGPDPTVVVPYEVSNPTKCIIYRPVIYRYTVPSFSPTINTDRMWARNGIVGPPQVAKGNRVYLRRNVALTE
ncbi:hypothetical protein IWQ60_006914 [Tieghemiomyces parasiticus]|uniref:Uncharacterized protein n=1 Tax=Tieghemiomyces parasiticus TaxID=78921 RepID=A0A9W8A7J1_9FUNG|nr:hypothetical protein IWQ60_006914 [Tieghemiomyces parasiticus]